MRNKRTGLKALVLGAALAFGAGAASADTFTLNLSSPVTDSVLSGVKYSGENFMTLKLDSGFSAFAEVNTETMQDDTDYFAFAQKVKAGKWTLNGGLRVQEAKDNEDSTSDFALFASRSFNTEEGKPNKGFNLTTFGVFGLEDNFRRFGGWLSNLGDGKVQYDVGATTKHFNSGKLDQDILAGFHTSSAGFWAAKGTDDSWAGVFKVDRNEAENKDCLGILGFGKYKPHTDDYYGLVRIGSGVSRAEKDTRVAANNGIDALSGQFDVNGGIKLLRSIHGIHPYIGNRPSLHAEGAAKVAEFGALKDGEDHLVWGQAGGHLGRGVYGSLGAKYNQVAKRFEPIGEVHKEWKLKDGSVSLTGYLSEDPTLNVRYSWSW